MPRITPEVPPTCLTSGKIYTILVLVTGGFRYYWHGQLLTRFPCSYRPGWRNLVDATDLKSVGPSSPCRFDSGLRHQNNKYEIIIAGWSSWLARRAHNPEVVGSNPTPAIFFILRRCSSVGQSSGIIIRASGVRVPAPLLLFSTKNPPAHGSRRLIGEN